MFDLFGAKGLLARFLKGGGISAKISALLILAELSPLKAGCRGRQTGRPTYRNVFLRALLLLLLLLSKTVGRLGSWPRIQKMLTTEPFFLPYFIQPRTCLLEDLEANFK